MWLLGWHLLSWHSCTFSPLSSMLASSLVLTVCCCAALIHLLKGCLQLMQLLRAVLCWLLLCWLLIKLHIPADNHLVLVWHPDPVPMPMLAVSH
jgi:hypothetical protein